MGVHYSSTGMGKPSKVCLIACCLLGALVVLHLLHVSQENAFAVVRWSTPKVVTPGIPTVPETKAPFPQKIWQTSKTGPAGLDVDDRAAVHSWTKLNPKWRYEIMTKFSAETYVKERFADDPEMQEVFVNIQDPILRADLIRYMVLLGDGGVYGDLDTRALQPIESWVPSAYQDLANVVVGVEYDRLDGGRWGDWTLDLQFCTWTILARPNHPLLRLTVDNVIQSLKFLAVKQGVTVSGIKPSYKEVLDTTGPAMFTKSAFEYLSHKTQSHFTWLNVTGLETPMLVGDVLILPINGFGSGQAHSGSKEPEDDDSALVQHLWKGSWKVDHPFRGDEEDAKSKPEPQETPEAEVTSVSQQEPVSEPEAPQTED